MVQLEEQEWRAIKSNTSESSEPCMHCQCLMQQALQRYSCITSARLMSNRLRIITLRCDTLPVHLWHPHMHQKSGEHLQPLTCLKYDNRTNHQEGHHIHT